MFLKMGLGYRGFKGGIVEVGLLNYTTTIEATKTVSEIHRILALHGAKSILTDYSDDGQIEALSFRVMTPQGEAGIRLPIDPDAVLSVLQRQSKLAKVPRRYVNKSQAVRIAWRIIKDWVASQMAILETEMVKMEQIFLPYIISQDGRTLYEVAISTNLLTGGRQ